MPAKRKLIGLTGPSSFTQECMDAIEEFFDANFVLLYHGRDANVAHWLDQVDGVILAGGIDIHPTVYSESVWSNHNLSKFDIMLGICRCHQLLGIRHGMGFVMDISGSSICHQPQRQQIQYNTKEPMHSVKIVNPEVVYGVYGMPHDPPERKVMREVLSEKHRDRIWVNSFHHQAVAFNPKRKYKDEGIDILGLGRVDLQCCKEIVELMQGPKWLSCQWHPEYDWRDNTASRVILERFKTLLNAE